MSTFHHSFRTLISTDISGELSPVKPTGIFDVSNRTESFASRPIHVTPKLKEPPPKQPPKKKELPPPKQRTPPRVQEAPKETPPKEKETPPKPKKVTEVTSATKRARPAAIAVESSPAKKAKQPTASPTQTKKVPRSLINNILICF